MQVKLHLVHAMRVHESTVHSLHILDNTSIKRLSVRCRVLREEHNLCVSVLISNLFPESYILI